MGKIKRFVAEKVFAKEIKESTLPSGGGVDSDEHLFRRISQQDRDLNPVQHRRMLDVCYYLWLTNPAARDVVETIVDYVLGEGVTVTAPEAEVQEVIDNFWGINNLNTELERRLRELSIYGEQILPVAVTPADGSVRLGAIDPRRVSRVLLNPDNMLQVDSVLVSSQTLAGIGYSPDAKPYTVVRPDENAASPTFGRLMAPTDDSCFYFSINRVSDASRGISDLYDLADWLDGYDQMLWNRIERSALTNAFVWDVLLESADDKQIDAWLAKNSPPKAGSIRAHNERVKWEAVTPDMRAQDASVDLRSVRGQVHWGAKQPEHWAGFGETANRATAAEMADPPLKRLSRRQKHFRAMVTELIVFALDQARIARYLTVPADPAKAREYLAFSVDFPEMSMKDLAKGAAALHQGVSALALAKQSFGVPDELSRKVVASLISQVGVDVDPDDLEAEEQETSPIAEALRVYRS